MFKPIPAYQIVDNEVKISFGSVKSEDVSWLAGGLLSWNGSELQGTVAWGLVLPGHLSMCSFEGSVKLRLSEDFEMLTGTIHFKKNVRVVSGDSTPIEPFHRQITLRRES